MGAIRNARRGGIILRDCRLLSNDDYECAGREQYNGNPYFTSEPVMVHRYRIVEL